jgi:hypothetical protein
VSDRHFPPPWSVEELDACFVVKDSAGQKLAYVYCEDEPAGDQPPGGHRFDYTRGVCVMCGMSCEEFKNNDYPKCAGEPYGGAVRRA